MDFQDASLRLAVLNELRQSEYDTRTMSSRRRRIRPARPYQAVDYWLVSDLQFRIDFRSISTSSHIILDLCRFDSTVDLHDNMDPHWRLPASSLWSLPRDRTAQPDPEGAHGHLELAPCATMWLRLLLL